MGILPNFPVLVGNLTICIDVRFTPADNYSILVGNDWLRLAQADLLLSKWLQVWAFIHHMQLMPNTALTLWANPISPVNICMPAHCHRKVMTTQSEPQKLLHTPTSHRHKTISRLAVSGQKPVQIGACQSPRRRGCTRVRHPRHREDWTLEITLPTPMTGRTSHLVGSSQPTLPRQMETDLEKLCTLKRTESCRLSSNMVL